MGETVMNLETKLGEKISKDIFERQFYRRDLAPVPEILSKTLFNTMPDLVCRPENTNDITEILEYARSKSLPVIPRGAGTSAYMNTVPVKGGIVVDFNGMSGVLDIDRENLTVDVLSGTPIKVVEESLENEGLAILSCPTSAVSATVGGWFNMEGYGIGSAEYGCFHDQVESAEIVLANGQVINSKNDSEIPLSYFTGTEGTMGIATKLKFKIRKKPKAEKNVAVGFQSFKDLEKFIQAVMASKNIPYSVHYNNYNFAKMLSLSGFETSLKNLETATVTYQGSEENIKNGIKHITKLAGDYKGQILDQKIADEEWNDRFYALRIKRNGPTLLASEVVLPINKLEQFSRIAKKMGQMVALYGHVITPDKVNALAMYYADETKILEYLFLLAKTQKVYNAASKLGGRSYGIGVWNSVYNNKSSIVASRISKLKTLKNKLDQNNILNPGKFYGPPSVLLNPTFFGVAASVANITGSLLGIGKGR